MVMKRGWLRIVEVVAAIIIIFASVLIVINDSSSKMDDGLCSAISPILEEIAKNQSLRNFALNGQEEQLDKFVETRISNPVVNHEIHVCDPENFSGCVLENSGIDGEICAGERIISTSISQAEVKPIKVKLFLYR